MKKRKGGDGRCLIHQFNPWRASLGIRAIDPPLSRINFAAGLGGRVNLHTLAAATRAFRLAGYGATIDLAIVVAGSAIEKLCECALGDSLADRGSVVRAARCLLGSVTKVLLLADIVVVNQLLHAKDKVARSLGRLESVSNFTEFVKAFSQFGGEMVELAHLTGDRQVRVDSRDSMFLSRPLSLSRASGFHC